MKKLTFLIISIISLSFFISCEDNDDFSSDSNLKLAFSSDTIRFDTVFTTFGTATKRMRVYNRNKNSITLESVELMSGGESGFRINVDGISGTNITDVDILKKDSIYIFLEVTVDPRNSNSPVLISDSIRFRYNGNTQYVQLEAFGQDVFIWKKKIIEKDTILTEEKPFVIFDSLIVRKDAILNLKENTRLYFHKNAGMHVYGSVNAKGTLDRPVVLRGNRTDNILKNVPYDRIPGQWDGIFVDSLSFNNYFEHTHIRNSVNGLLFRPSVLSQKKATFINSIVHNAIADGIYAVNCQIEGYNSLFSNSGGSVMKLIGGSYEFIHCTFANYMTWRKMDNILTIGNIIDDKISAPLNKCDIINSIVAGSGSTEVRELKSKNSSISFNRSFKYSFVKLDKNDSDIGNIWKIDPAFKFTDKGKIKTYYYNLELDSVSEAINKANIEYSIKWPLDMKGVSRLSDQGPDMGCYEWVKSGN